MQRNTPRRCSLETTFSMRETHTRTLQAARKTSITSTWTPSASKTPSSSSSRTTSPSSWSVSCTSVVTSEASYAKCSSLAWWSLLVSAYSSSPSSRIRPHYPSQITSTVTTSVSTTEQNQQYPPPILHLSSPNYVRPFHPPQLKLHILNLVIFLHTASSIASTLLTSTVIADWD